MRTPSAIAQLWLQNPALKGAWDLQKSGLSRINELADEYPLSGFRFVPLIRDGLACSLDFLILRREDPYRLFTGSGDIDGRIKTLIDGLRRPRQPSEIRGEIPAPTEDPFFCLLEDDDAVFNYSITTDRLLLPAEPEEGNHDVVVIINVKVTTAGGNPLTYHSPGFW